MCAGHLLLARKSAIVGPGEGRKVERNEPWYQATLFGLRDFHPIIHWRERHRHPMLVAPGLSRNPAGCFVGTERRRFSGTSANGWDDG